MRKYIELITYTTILLTILFLSIIISDTKSFIIPSKLNITVIRNTLYNQEDYRVIKNYYNKCSSEDLCLKSPLNQEAKKVLYSILKESGQLYQSKQLIRNINSPTKKILNGTFGTLFRFKLLGNILWLLIPLLLIFLIRKKYNILSHQEKKVLYFILTNYLIFFIIIIPYGYNYRYQLTLVPLTLLLILYFIEKIFITKKRYLIFLILMMIFNLIFFYLSPFINLTINQENKESEIKKAIEKSNKSPYEFIKKHKGIYLVNNTPEFYYYTEQKGYFYWSGSDEYTTKDGTFKLMTNHDLEKIKNILKNELKCQYIFTKSEFKRNNGKFRKFLEEKTELLYQDSTYEIYKL